MSETQLICGDGYEVIESLSAGSVDAVITDPPYGTTALAWDKRMDYARFWAGVTRVVKETGIIAVFCAQPMMTDLINSNRKHFRYDLIWHKTTPVGFLDANRRPLRAHENIAIFCQKWRGAGNAKLSTYNPQFWYGKPYAKRAAGKERCAHYGTFKDVQRGSEDGRRHPISVLQYANRAGGRSWHPTAKPVELLRWLVATYTEPGELILDPFMGSGPTGVAAVELGRRFVGVEMEPGYHAIAEQRINEAG